MRKLHVLQLACLAALAACAVESPDTFREDRRARLERMLRPRTDAQVLDEVLASTPRRGAWRPAVAPPQGTQDPRNPQDPQDPERSGQHIDQRLPPREGTGERSFLHDWQPLEAGVEVGLGDVMVRASRTPFDDRSDALFVRAKVQNGRGAGLHLGWWDSESKLFDGRMMSDGVAPRPAQAELMGAEAFPHAVLDGFTLGEVEVPVRVGAFVELQSLDHDQAAVERRWLSIGPRVALEPRWTMLAGRDGELELFGNLAGDVGPSWFDEKFANGAADDLVGRWSAEVALGVRGRYGALHGELGYRLRHTTFGATDGELFGDPSRTELQQRQLFLGVGVTW